MAILQTLGVKTGARNETDLRCREKQKLEPEKCKNQSLQECKPQIPKGVKSGAQKIEKAEPKNM